MNETLSYSTVSRGDCVPLTGNLFIRHPGRFDELFIGLIEMIWGLFFLEIFDSLTTTNYVARIDDPSIFDIPAECQ